MEMELQDIRNMTPSKYLLKDEVEKNEITHKN
jgi:hypothetical protein